ncbi:rhomboid family intramembrane serine protease [Microvirga puerhi]|uniref:Rhomboid family intramembrane serine protease n=1 Tax=Microvirga puerhi TaxID=2876078 RepID=A0ABS7VJ09_9HYPH|nr:rhomboid family intramembrane serine protease [Microvirga puerhi]MBZ6075493.1 rhomboid family intramembrane serine protease [Microvirga puerhi]
MFSNRSREPILNLPAVVAWSIGGLIAIHLLRTFLPEDTDFRILIDWAVIPARWSVAYGGVEAQEVLSALRHASPSGEASPFVALGQYVLQNEDGRPWTAVTYALLHGSWSHVLINSIWLAAFGTPIARRCGAARFFALAVLSAIGGAVLYAYMNALQIMPMIGASAAVSGMMAAASWFMFAPADWHPEGRPTQPHERPRERLIDIVRNRQVLIFLAVWFAANYVFGFVQPLGVTDASVAWEAHIGGFLVGLGLFPVLDPLPARQSRFTA